MLTITCTVEVIVPFLNRYILFVFFDIFKSLHSIFVSQIKKMPCTIKKKKTKGNVPVCGKARGLCENGGG